FSRSSVAAPGSPTRLTLPVQFLAGGAYHTDRWTVASEVGQGLQHFEYRGGGEYRLTVLEFRGGGHYKNKAFQPTGGVGFNITRGLGLDVAVYGTSANIERKRRAALALSLRIGSSY